MNKKIKILAKINCLYSIAWMKATGKGKYAFREESKVHEFLINQIVVLIKKSNNN